VFTAPDGAIYKGVALANNGTGNFLYLADFHNNKIDVLDSQFQPVTLGSNGFGTFTDPGMQAGFAPFNIANINGKLFVSYAKQDANAEDDVAGAGNGFVDVFDPNGTFLGRAFGGGDLNSPWGMVMAPAGFGDFGGALLIGNFGDGLIHAFSTTTWQELGTLSSSPGNPLAVDGLWGLAFGNGGHRRRRQHALLRRRAERRGARAVREDHGERRGHEPRFRPTERHRTDHHRHRRRRPRPAPDAPRRAVAGRAGRRPETGRVRQRRRRHDPLQRAGGGRQVGCEPEGQGGDHRRRRGRGRPARRRRVE
jgi:hypothetical protein